jgi:hypothetical protein
VNKRAHTRMSLNVAAFSSDPEARKAHRYRSFNAAHLPGMLLTCCWCCCWAGGGLNLSWARCLCHLQLAGYHSGV